MPIDSAFRIYVVMSASGILSVVRTYRGTSVVEQLNGGAPLNANCAYLFDVFNVPGESINLRYSVDATILKCQVIAAIKFTGIIAMPYPPQGPGIRLPIDASMVKGVPAPATLFTDNTLHSTTTETLLHSINLPSDRPYNLGARFSVRTTNVNYDASVKLSAQVRAGSLLRRVETPIAFTRSTTFTTLEVGFDTLLFVTVAELWLAAGGGPASAESQYEELLASSGKLVGD